MSKEIEQVRSLPAHFDGVDRYPINSIPADPIRTPEQVEQERLAKAKKPFNHCVGPLTRAMAATSAVFPYLVV